MQIWNNIFEAGKEYGIKPAGLGARDTLRLEMGFCLYGNELNDETTPLEAGLSWITKFVDGNNFIARTVLEKQKAIGLTRKLIGFTLSDKGIPRSGYEIVDKDGNVIGNVTSGTISPINKVGIGLGYVKPEFSKPETELFIKVRNKNLKAVVSKLPFRK